MHKLTLSHTHTWASLMSPPHARRESWEVWSNWEQIEWRQGAKFSFAVIGLPVSCLVPCTRARLNVWECLWHWGFFSVYQSDGLLDRYITLRNFHRHLQASKNVRRGKKYTCLFLLMFIYVWGYRWVTWMCLYEAFQHFWPQRDIS